MHAIRLAGNRNDYALMKCQPIIAGDQWTCKRCGYSGRTKQTEPRLIHRQCTAEEIGAMQSAAGIIRAVTGTGGADSGTIEFRTMICNGCPFAVLVLGTIQRCTLCGCATWAKIRNADASCPNGRWPAVIATRVAE